MNGFILGTGYGCMKEGRSTGLDIFWALKVSIFRKDLGLVEGANTVGKSLYSIILV